MKKLDQYVFKELFVPFLIGTFAVVLMFQANTVIALLKTFSLRQVPLLAIFQYIIYKTPEFLQMTLPVGMSLASSLAVSRLARESELTAMRAAGISIRRFMLPVAIFGLVVAAGDFVVVQKVMPPASLAARQLANRVGLLGAIPDFQSNVVVKLKNRIANIAMVTKGTGDTLKLSKILLWERGVSVDEVNLCMADHGEYKNGVWKLYDTYWWHIKKGELDQAYTKDVVPIDEPISVESVFTRPEAEEQSIEQLRESIAQVRKLGNDTTNLEISYHTKFSVPAACLIFALVGPIFAIMFARGGGFVGILISVIMVMAYYNLHIVSVFVLGRNGMLSPFVAAWMPNALFIGLSLFGLRRLE